MSFDEAIPARRTFSPTTVNCEKPTRPRETRVASSQSLGMSAHLFDAETVASAPWMSGIVSLSMEIRAQLTFITHARPETVWCD